MSGTIPNDPRSAILIQADELATLLNGGADVVLLDIRFRPDRPDGRPAYLAGHIPGAVYVDLPSELAGEQRGFSGRRPLPAIGDLELNARRWGIRSGATVIVYDDNRGLQAARAWWVLRWAGIADVRLLDGGLDAWTANGGELTDAVPLSTAGDVVLSSGHLPVLDADGAADLARTSILLDARGRDAYLGASGKAEGHIPGALSVPTSENLTETGRVASPEHLRARFAKLGIDGSRPLGAYCGGGVAAAHEILVLATLGLSASLFPGSWSAWSSDPSRPVATGAAPG